MRTLALLLMLLALPAWGRELRLATWNLGWLTTDPAGLPDNARPASPADLARLARRAAALDADVIALQGIDAPAAATVFAGSRLEVADDDARQHTGFALRAGLPATRQADATELVPYPYARLPLRAGTEIALGPLHLLSVHLKSGCRNAPLDSDQPACATLSLQLDALHDWVAAQPGPFAILGDFGRIMDGADPSLARIGPGLMRAEAGFASPCRGGSAFVDHIVLGGGAAALLVPGSLRVMVPRGTEPGGTTHCPISVRLVLPDP